MYKQNRHWWEKLHCKSWLYVAGFDETCMASTHREGDMAILIILQLPGVFCWRNEIYNKYSSIY